MTAESARDPDVIIVGAGIVGAVLAAVLLKRGIVARGRLTLLANRFEPAVAPEADWDLRVFALSRASERLLSACDAWPLPGNRIQAYERMCVWDEHDAPTTARALRLDCAEFGEPNLGHIVDASTLQSVCLDAARRAGAQLLEGECSEITQSDGRARVRLRDGRALHAGLLVGADGVDSTVRERLNIDTAGHTYHQDALVAHVHTAKLHAATAWQRFLQAGPIALLPLSDGRSSIVWSVARHDSARLRALPAAEFGAAVTRASGDVLGDCTLASAVAAFPLRLQYAAAYAQPHAVLIGDAAHVVHPLAGQGLNLGLLDCAVLAEVLGAAGGAARFGDMAVLRRYERRRRSENLKAAALLDGIERMPRLLRSLALGGVSQVRALKGGAIRHALGLAGDVPAFLRADRS